jgi:hypothetical protein
VLLIGLYYFSVAVVIGSIGDWKLRGNMIAIFTPISFFVDDPNTAPLILAYAFALQLSFTIVIAFAISTKMSVRPKTASLLSTA